MNDNETPFEISLEQRVSLYKLLKRNHDKNDHPLEALLVKIEKDLYERFTIEEMEGLL